MRIKLTAILLLFYSQISFAADDNVEVPVFAALDEQIITEFATAINSGGTFSKLDPPKAKMSGEEGLVWAGSKAKTQTTLKTCTVYFEGEAEKRSSIKIDYAGKILNIKVSSAIDPRFRVGFFAELSPSAPNQTYISESANTGYLLIAPKTTSSDWLGIGFCPLQINTFKDEKNRERSKATSANIAPVTLNTPVKGIAQGAYRSGSATAEVFARIFTTPNLPPTDRVEEHIVESNPEAELEYIPRTLGWKQEDAPKSLVSGIKASVELVAPGGQRLKEESEAVVYVKDFILTKLAAITIDGKEVQLESLRCFAVLRHS